MNRLLICTGIYANPLLGLLYYSHFVTVTLRQSLCDSHFVTVIL